MTRLQSFQRSYQVRTTAVSRVKDRAKWMCTTTFIRSSLRPGRTCWSPTESTCSGDIDQNVRRRRLVAEAVGCPPASG